ncbi:hypothetical protein [Burkholderia multivorans]|uniref:hypothetical protein n=1 Tax=Burkholderia multivorans TaxID=87883 RepID=UPI0011B2682E|nr:hypothetical protein [Burkholderia multivorans]
MQTNNAVLESAKRAMQFLLPPHDTEAERAAAMAAAERALLEVTTAFIRAGRDDLAMRASELAMDAR